MFENILAQLPAEAPRSLNALPGLRSAGLRPTVLLFPLIFMTAFLVMPVAILLSNPIYRLLHGETASAQARILAATECRSCGGNIRYVFTAADGRDYRSPETAHASQDADAPLRPNDTLPVLYLAADPSVNAPAVSVTAARAIPFFLPFLIPLFALVMFLAIFLRFFRRAWQVRRIVRRGVLAEAKIFYVRTPIHAWQRSSMNGLPEVFLTYRSAGGETIEARAKCANHWLIGQLSKDSIVHIAYLPNKPTVAVLLEEYIR